VKSKIICDDYSTINAGINLLLGSFRRILFFSTYPSLCDMSHNSRYALTELLVCGDCGTAYRRVTWAKRGKKKVVWRCVSRLDYGTKYCKNSPTIDEEALHAAVLTALNTAMENREQLIGILKLNLEITLSEKNGEEVNPILLENRIRELQKTMMELVAVTIKAGNTGSYDEKFKAISDEIMSLQETLDRHKAQQNGPDALSLQIEDLCKALRDAPFECAEYKDSIVRQMIDTIKVINADTLRIIFKGGYEVEQYLNTEGCKK